MGKTQVDLIDIGGGLKVSRFFNVHLQIFIKWLKCTKSNQLSNEI